MNPARRNLRNARAAYALSRQRLARLNGEHDPWRRADALKDCTAARNCLIRAIAYAQGWLEARRCSK